MSGLVAPLADGVEVHRTTRVTALAEGRVWAGDTDHGVFSRVVVTVPAPQAAELVPSLADQIGAAPMVPNITAMAAFAAPLAAPDIPEVSGDVGWAVRNSAKPGREGETWVIQASEAWSQAHLEVEKDAAATALFAAFRAQMPCDVPAPVYLAGHRWRYAFVDTPLGVPFLQDGATFLAGDWCLGRRVEDAWESGRAVAAAVLEGL